MKDGNDRDAKPWSRMKNKRETADKREYNTEKKEETEDNYKKKNRAEE